ncbi:MAG TPA: TonB-dependent receptor, partial [Chitinophagales bacterium]
NIGNARIVGTDVALGMQATVKDWQFNFLAGYTYINTKSLNWNKPLTLYNSQGQVIQPGDPYAMYGLGTSAYNNANAPANIDTNTQITYGMLSSSSQNMLKYRPTHQFKLIFGVVYKKFDVTLDYQYISYVQNIDYAFVSTFFTKYVPGLTGITAFQALKEYRDAYAAKGNPGYNIVNISLGYKPTDHLKLAFIIKNAANWEWMTRPGMFQAPRNYTLQVSYQF